MNRLIPLTLLPLLAGSALAAQDHDAAPMMAEPDAPMTGEAFEEGNKAEGRQATADTILERFREQYGDTPRFAVFWHRDFPSRVSDWRSNHRAVLGISGEASGTEKGEPTDIKGKGSISAQAEYREDRTQPENRTAFALQGGLIDTFREGGAKVIDQSMAQRITDNALEDGTFSRLSPDQARLEMRALSQHADYVLELNSADDFAESGQYQIRVLSVKDASVLATFATDGEPPEGEREEKWVASDHGYQKKERPLSMTEVGRELALQTMERLAR